MYAADLDDVSTVFLKYKDDPPIHYNMAPVTGAVAWIHELNDRMNKGMEKLKSVSISLLSIFDFFLNTMLTCERL